MELGVEDRRQRQMCIRDVVSTVDSASAIDLDLYGNARVTPLPKGRLLSIFLITLSESFQEVALSADSLALDSVLSLSVCALIWFRLVLLS